ncbi:hypothetical protein LZ554_008403 [Drepanopeziza brunnea f. sp. 'monogermtubi']|nr:hypothetical protein LZ554_008403 [Drepanopeziza brunnea f. sp. 'monogermtubi']
MAADFSPALIVVDVQEDFCPPNGSLAVADGRAIISTVNDLLALPFTLKIATKDWHPAKHISFASSHPSKRAFLDTTTITNPSNAAESYESRLWPDHCVQHTPGAELVPELNVGRVDRVVEKGTESAVEMYSAFYSPLREPRCGDSGLVGVLKGKSVTHVHLHYRSKAQQSRGVIGTNREPAIRVVQPRSVPSCRVEFNIERDRYCATTITIDERTDERTETFHCRNTLRSLPPKRPSMAS